MPVCVEDNPYSQGKSFGKVLAYLSGQVAVVASCEAEHPVFFKHRVNGMLIGNSVEEWAQSICELVSDLELRESIARRGNADFLSRLTTPTFAARLDEVLKSVVCPPPAQ
jgi:glycosyltransferase involved in cell wall biosynthesis